MLSCGALPRCSAWTGVSSAAGWTDAVRLRLLLHFKLMPRSSHIIYLWVRAEPPKLKLRVRRTDFEDRSHCCQVVLVRRLKPAGRL